MDIRKPAVAGQFYPSDKEELLSAIKESFTGKFGPGTLPGKRGNGKVGGVISPHAGYFFSGAGAAHVFKEIGEAAFADTYVIIGVNHSGPWTCSNGEDWETPLGVVKCDIDFVRLMYKKGLQMKSEEHHNEHSIEVQLPFLQFVSSDRIDELRIVPIMVADEQPEIIGRVIMETARELKRNIVVICSSDMTHYGASYGFLPFRDNVAENMKKFDGKAIEKILDFDNEGFFEYCEETGATICGRYGISALMWLMKKGKMKGELLKYYTSGDVLGDYSNAVGYGAVVFR